MDHCVYCGRDAESSGGGLPVCSLCSDRIAGIGLPGSTAAGAGRGLEWSKEQVEAILRADVDAALKALKSDGSSSARGTGLEALAEALGRYNAFVQDGTIPDDLRRAGLSPLNRPRTGSNTGTE